MITIFENVLIMQQNISKCIQIIMLLVNFYKLEFRYYFVCNLVVE